MADGTKNIVIIDDDITALDIIAFLFEGKGYKVHRCANGQSAIDLVAKNPPELMLVDLMMPGINGIETIRAIRKLGQDKIPIVAFTASENPEIHTEAQNAGCNILLTKPCPSDKLVKTIKALLGDPL